MDTHEPDTYEPPIPSSAAPDPLRCPWCGRHFDDVEAPVGHFAPRSAIEVDAVQWVHNACKHEHQAQ